MPSQFNSYNCSILIMADQKVMRFQDSPLKSEIFRSVHKAGVEPDEAESIMLSLVERCNKWN